MRKWFLNSYTPETECLSGKKITFFTRTPGKDLRHGRRMDPEQEQYMISEIKHLTRRFDRPEELVVYDGSISYCINA